MVDLEYIYGITKAEAKELWYDKPYREVLSNKISLAQKLQSELIKEPMMKRDQNRITAIGKSISHNFCLIKEIE